ncbi:MAG TPA: single-stranded DNA-binding protein [Calditrichaeota bacterium]|nr:single-stranded DNA-binding protein [Calditrichota bacterium]
MSRGTVNKVILVGRVGRDAELRYTPSGASVASFSLATNFRAKDANGNWQDNTEWHNVSAFGTLADFAGQYIKKGRLLYVEGRLHTRSWEDQNNTKHYRTEIIANSIQLLGPKPEEGAEPVVDDSAAQTPAPNNTVEEPPIENTPTDEEDLPF